MRSKLCTLALGLLYGIVAGLVPERVLAQEAGATTTLIMLGTQGGPRHTRARSQPANAIIVNGQPYLIDAGNGVGRQLVLGGHLSIPDPPDLHHPSPR